MTEPVEPNTQPASVDDAAAEQALAQLIADQPADDQMRSDGGKKALQAEREARKALEKQLADLAPLADLVKRIRGGDGVPEQQKTEVDRLNERLAEVERAANDERMQRLRLEVAAEKGLTSAQAARLAGSSKDELVADADALLALFPTTPATPPGPRAPAPDPSQGGTGTPGLSELDAAIQAAEKAGNTAAVVALKTRKFAETHGK